MNKPVKILLLAGVSLAFFTGANAMTVVNHLRWSNGLSQTKLQDSNGPNILVNLKLGLTKANYDIKSNSDIKVVGKAGKVKSVKVKGYASSLPKSCMQRVSKHESVTLYGTYNPNTHQIVNGGCSYS